MELGNILLLVVGAVGVGALLYLGLTLLREVKALSTRLESRDLDGLGKKFEKQATAAARLLEVAGKRVSEFESASERHGETLRASAMASLEEVVTAAREVRDELQKVSQRQADSLKTQEETAKVLERLSQSLDGYVELLQKTAA